MFAKEKGAKGKRGQTPTRTKWSCITNDSKRYVDRKTDNVFRLRIWKAMKTQHIIALLSVIFLCSCSKQEVESCGSLEGDWLLSGEAANNRRIRLSANGNAYFMNVQGNDIGIQTHNLISPNGRWALSHNGKLLEMEFDLDGALYSHSGKIAHVKEGFEIWFCVGDPDDFVWRKYVREAGGKRGQTPN